jgi:hypothetical protein
MLCVDGGPPLPVLPTHMMCRALGWGERHSFAEGLREPNRRPAQLTNAPRSTDNLRFSHPMCTGKTVAWYSEHSDDAAIWQRADAARLQQLRESI